MTGDRRGEVIALQWDDVDLVSGVLRLDENYVRTADGMIPAPSPAATAAKTIGSRMPSLIT